MTDTTRTTRREVTLPAAAFLDLLAVAQTAGGEQLRARGRTAGAAMAERLLSTQDDATTTRALPTSVFWRRVNELFGARGWGLLSHESVTAGVGELRSADWIEAERTHRTARCEFTAGVLEGVLRAVSGADVHVREAECRAAGDAACRFRFGSRAALDAAEQSSALAV